MSFIIKMTYKDNYIFSQVFENTENEKLNICKCLSLLELFKEKRFFKLKTRLICLKNNEICRKSGFSNNPVLRDINGWSNQFNCIPDIEIHEQYL